MAVFSKTKGPAFRPTQTENEIMALEIAYLSILQPKSVSLEIARQNFINNVVITPNIIAMLSQNHPVAQMEKRNILTFPATAHDKTMPQPSDTDRKTLIETFVNELEKIHDTSPKDTKSAYLSRMRRLVAKNNSLPKPPPVTVQNRHNYGADIQNAFQKEFYKDVTKMLGPDQPQPPTEILTISEQIAKQTTISETNPRPAHEKQDWLDAPQPEITHDIFDLGDHIPDLDPIAPEPHPKANDLTAQLKSLRKTLTDALDQIDSLLNENV